MSALNVHSFKARLYAEGHRPEDFEGRLAPHLIIVAPVLPPGRSLGGIHVPTQATDLLGQFAMAHVVVALPASDMYRLRDGTVVADGSSELAGAEHVERVVLLWGARRVLRVGDIIKAREAHLDPVQARGGLCSLPLDHIVAVLADADAIDWSDPRDDHAERFAAKARERVAVADTEGAGVA